MAQEAFTNAAPTSTLVAQGVTDAAAINKAYLALSHLLELPGNAHLAPHLADQVAAYDSAQSNLGPFLASQVRTPQTAGLAAAETSAEAVLDNSLSTLQSTISNRLDTTAAEAQAAASAARVDLLWSIAVGLAIALAVTVLLTRHALFVERKQARREAEQSELADRIAFRGEPADRARDVEGRGFGL